MRTKNFALLALLIVLMFSAESYAYKVQHYREDQGLRSEAALRNIRLIPLAEAQAIAANRLRSNTLKFTNIELVNNVSRVSSDTSFRPVYKVECALDGSAYRLYVDAVTGIILPPPPPSTLAGSY